MNARAWALGLALLCTACHERSPTPTPTPIPGPQAASPNPCRAAPAPPTPPPQAGHCEPLHPQPDAQRFADQLKQRVRSQDDRIRVRVSFDCSTVGGEILSASGLRSAIHAGSLLVWKLQRDAATFSLRALRSIATGKPELAADSGEVEYLTRTLSTKDLEPVFERARLALSANIQTTLPQRGGIHLDAIVGNTGNAATELKLSTQAGHVLRAFYGDGAEIPGATPHLALDLSWESLAPLFAAPFEKRAPDDHDRALLSEVWAQAADRPSWIEARLLELAASAGSPQLLGKILPALDAQEPGTRVRAVRALAAITHWDKLHDAQGRVRDLAEVVSDYKRECAR